MAPGPSRRCTALAAEHWVADTKCKVCMCRRPAQEAAARRFASAATISARIPNRVRRFALTWLARGCLTCDAIRAGRRVVTNHRPARRIGFNGIATDASNDNRAVKAVAKRHEKDDSQLEKVLTHDVEGVDGDEDIKAVSRTSHQKEETSIPRSCFHR